VFDFERAFRQSRVTGHQTVPIRKFNPHPYVIAPPAGHHHQTVAMTATDTTYSFHSHSYMVRICCYRRQTIEERHVLMPGGPSGGVRSTVDAPLPRESKCRFHGPSFASTRDVVRRVSPRSPRRRVWPLLSMIPRPLVSILCAADHHGPVEGNI
jgi:hypothetical protein